LDIAVVVRHADGTFTFDRKPFPGAANILACTTVGFLAGLVVAAPLTGATVGALLGGVGTAAAAAEAGIGQDFIREVEALMRPGTSARPPPLTAHLSFLAFFLPLLPLSATIEPNTNGLGREKFSRPKGAGLGQDSGATRIPANSATSSRPAGRVPLVSSVSWLSWVSFLSFLSLFSRKKFVSSGVGVKGMTGIPQVILPLGDRPKPPLGNHDTNRGPYRRLSFEGSRSSLKGFPRAVVPVGSEGHMGDSPVTRSSLLVRIRDARDKDAWDQFVEIYAPLVYQLGRKRGLQDADAADLTQEVLRAVAGAAGRLEYDRRRGSFRSWLYTVARNKLHNFLTARRRHREGCGDPGALDRLPDPRALDEEAALWDQDYERRLVDWAAGQVRGAFEPSSWQAFWLTAVEGRSAKQAAQALGLSVGAVYIAKSRVLTRLREKIRQFQDE
jgi:RNA polymerase sigma-70 factor (ECF subfamily)